MRLLFLVCLSFVSTIAQAQSTTHLLELEHLGQPLLNSPDPFVFKVVDKNKNQFYLTYTIGSGNTPIFKSEDLIHWKFSHFAFKESDFTMSGEAMKFGEYYYCHIWAPEFHEGKGKTVYHTFTAVRRKTPPPEGRCLDYNQDSGVYIAESETGINGPFKAPQPLTTDPSCAPSKNRRPASPETAFSSCEGGECDAFIRLDQTVFKDKGKLWLGYSWYANSQPNAWEKENYGEHINVTTMDPKNPGRLSCDSGKEKFSVANPHDKKLLTQLAASCAGCEKNLSFTTEKHGRPFLINGYLQGVAEGAGFFRRGDWVYMLASGGIWDSKSYHVFWTAAKTMDGLSGKNPDRLAGRFLIPDAQYSYGHGTIIEKAPGEFYYLYHRLDHIACTQKNDCRRRLMISPLEFEDKKDGNGPMHIKPLLFK